MRTRWTYNRIWYFRYVEPKVLQGWTLTDCAKHFGVSKQFMCKLNRRYKGTKPITIRLRKRIDARQQKKLEKLLAKHPELLDNTRIGNEERSSDN